MRILVAEDEADLARTLRKALTEDGYAVDWHAERRRRARESHARFLTTPSCWT